MPTPQANPTLMPVTTTAPMPSPSPSPTTSSLVFFHNPCGNNFPSQGEEALSSVEGRRFHGMEIRSDAWVNLCDDCVVRCFLQMPGTCVGFVWEHPEESPSEFLGRCTYYSHIDSIANGTSDMLAVTTTSLAA